MAFTMNLPSNSSLHTFPNNSLTTYNTLLAEYVTSPIPLEVALQEITCPTTWYNVAEEPMLIIQGANQTSNLAHLQSILQRRRTEFFKGAHTRELKLSRGVTTRHDTIAAACLEKGFTFTHIDNDAGNTSGTSHPSVDTEATTTTELPTSAPQWQAASALCKAKEALAEASLEPPYIETGLFLSPGKGVSKMTDLEIQAIKMALNLNVLDKVARAANFSVKRVYKGYYIEGAYLTSALDLIAYLNKAFMYNHPSVVKDLRTHYKNNRANIFNFNRFSLKCVISLPPGVLMQLPENLGLQLGFDGGNFLINKTKGTYVVDLNFRAQTIYIYSDIVKHNIVGDKRVPLLRVVNVNPLLGDTQTVSFQPLIYQPVSKTSFRQIAVYLRDNTGQPIPFERGEVNVVLAFRPLSNL
jgi:hypothetical protein